MPPRTEYAQIDSREVAYQLFGEGDAEVGGETSAILTGTGATPI
jgi:hypothetical protein